MEDKTSGGRAIPDLLRIDGASSDRKLRVRKMSGVAIAGRALGIGADRVTEALAESGSRTPRFS